MKIHCPDCKSLVPSANIELDKGWGKCDACQDVFPLSPQLPGYQAIKSQSEITSRPKHARAVVEEEGHRLLIHIPRKGMRASHWPTLFFAMVWIGFITFWTLGASGLLFGGEQKQQDINWGFAAFSIPFWLVGIGMVLGLLWDISHTRTMCLTPEEMSQKTSSWVYGRLKTIPRSKISLARHYETTVKSGENPKPRYGVEVLYDGGSVAIATDSEEEEKWLIGLVNGFLEQHPG